MHATRPKHKIFPEIFSILLLLSFSLSLLHINILAADKSP
jgi:hypothetical protein